MRSYFCELPIRRSRFLSRPRFTNQDGDLVIVWLSAMLRSEFVDGGVPLSASLTVFAE